MLSIFGDNARLMRGPFRVYHRIPVFGDVVYIMVCSHAAHSGSGQKKGIHGKLCLRAVCCHYLHLCTCAATAPPLAVAEEIGLEIGIFFFYALISAFVGMFVVDPVRQAAG